MAQIRFFAAAAEAVGHHEIDLTVNSVHDLRQIVAEQFGSTAEEVLGKCSILVNGVRATQEDSRIASQDTVDVLPPFAGG